MLDGVKRYAPVDREFPAKLLPPPPFAPHRETNSLGDYKGDMPARRGAHLPHSTHLSASTSKPIKAETRVAEVGALAVTTKYP